MSNTSKFCRRFHHDLNFLFFIFYNLSYYSFISWIKKYCLFLFWTWSFSFWPLIFADNKAYSSSCWNPNDLVFKPRMLTKFNFVEFFSSWSSELSISWAIFREDHRYLLCCVSFSLGEAFWFNFLLTGLVTSSSSVLFLIIGAVFAGRVAFLTAFGTRS